MEANWGAARWREPLGDLANTRRILETSGTFSASTLNAAPANPAPTPGRRLRHTLPVDSVITASANGSKRTGGGSDGGGCVRRSVDTFTVSRKDLPRWAEHTPPPYGSVRSRI